MFRIFNIFTAFILFSLASPKVFAAGGDGDFNPGEVILGHVKDAYEWHFFDIGEKQYSIPLPVMVYSSEAGGLQVFSASKFQHGKEAYMGYEIDKSTGRIIRTDGISFFDFSITKNVANLLISAVLLLLIMISVARKYKQRGIKSAPRGFQNAIEVIVNFVKEEVAKPNIGTKHYMRFMPFLLTVFFFIWLNNILGLFPGGANFTGNIAVTAVLGLISFVVIIFSANKHFWSHLFNPPGIPLPAKILLTIIEILSLFIKPVALTIRLFANILAGHIIILSIISIIFIFAGINAVAGWGFAPISIAFSVFMYALKLLVGAIQAFIFANLTAVFIGQGLEEGHHDGAHEHAAH